MSQEQKDGQDEVTVLPADAPPKDGVFRDWFGVQHDPTIIEDGNDLSRIIATDDDEDDGLDVVGKEPYRD